MQRITPRAKRVARERGLPLDGLQIEGTGFAGGVCEKDILDYLIAHRTKATPLARAIAQVEAIDLEQVKGTGIGGKIMKADVAACVTSLASGTFTPVAVAADVATAIPGGSYCEAPKGGTFSEDGKEILSEAPYTGIRKVIGERMSESKFTAPHLYFTQKVNLEALLNMRKQINKAQEDKKTSVTDYIAAATVLVLQKYPEMNASLLGETIVQYKSVNIGIAVAAPTGLIVPNVKDAQNLSLLELSKAAGILFDKAREGKLLPEEYTGGTFTISNLGMFGIENFTAIINPPESGILAISATKEEPIVAEAPDGTKSIQVKPMMNIQLTVDHRIIDGLLAARFVTEIKELLENPIRLLL